MNCWPKSGTVEQILTTQNWVSFGFHFIPITLADYKISNLLVFSNTLINKDITTQFAKHYPNHMKKFENRLAFMWYRYMYTVFIWSTNNFYIKIIILVDL